MRWAVRLSVIYAHVIHCIYLRDSSIRRASIVRARHAKQYTWNGPSKLIGRVGASPPSRVYGNFFVIYHSTDHHAGKHIAGLLQV